MEHHVLTQEPVAVQRIRQRLTQHAYQHCIPLHTTLEITIKCNLRCLHCYNFDRTQPYPKERIHAELQPEEVKRILSELHEAGTLFLSLTGGEALAHPRLLDYVSWARELGMVVTLKTNGTLIDAETAAALHDAGVSAAHISLYGGSPSTHDTFTVREGSFQKSLEACSLLKEAGIATRISYCLTQHNAHEIDAMLETGGRLGIGVQVDPQLTKRYDGTDESLAHRLTRETLHKLYAGPLKAMLPTPNHSPARSVQCSCARSVCGITAEGIVYPCIGAPIPSGNLREQSFAEIWKNSPQFQKIRGLTLDDFATCKTCGDRAFCSRSSGVVYCNTDDYTGPEEWTCMQASVIRDVHEGMEPPPGPIETTKNEHSSAVIARVSAWLSEP